MKLTPVNGNRSTFLSIVLALALVSLCVSTVSVAAESEPKKAQAATAANSAAPRSFDTPQQAADVLVDSAEKFDVGALAQIFGPNGEDIIFSGEFAQDRKHAADFAAQAREKTTVSVDSKSRNRAFVLVGKEDWPFPVPLVKMGDKWSFDAKAGHHELLYRRIGANELDAIQVCQGRSEEHT